MLNATYKPKEGIYRVELLQIKMLNTVVERILNKELSELGLTFAQATVIGYLLENHDKDVCQRDIEYSLGLTHSTISSILSCMEANNLICAATSASDSRYKKNNTNGKGPKAVRSNRGKI